MNGKSSDSQLPHFFFLIREHNADFRLRLWKLNDICACKEHNTESGVKLLLNIVLVPVFPSSPLSFLPFYN